MRQSAEFVQKFAADYYSNLLEKGHGKNRGSVHPSVVSKSTTLYTTKQWAAIIYTAR